MTAPPLESGQVRINMLIDYSILLSFHYMVVVLFVIGLDAA